MRSDGAETTWTTTFNLILDELISKTTPANIGEALITKAAKIADLARDAYSKRFQTVPDTKDQESGPRTGPPNYIDEFDEESVLLNMAVSSSLANKAEGKTRVSFNCSGLVKYNAASSIYLPQGDARVLLEKVRPTPSLKDVLPLSQIPTYEDMVSMVKDRYWGGEASTFKWTIYTHGHRQMASDTFMLDADPTKQEQMRNAIASVQVQQKEPTLPEPTEDAARHPNPCRPPIPFAFPPTGGVRFPLPCPLPLPSPQHGTTAGVPQQSKERPPSTRKNAPGMGWVGTGPAAKSMGLSMDRLRTQIRIKATEQMTKDGCNVMMGNGIIAKKFGSIWMLNLPKV
jgi:hypothetical protein